MLLLKVIALCEGISSVDAILQVRKGRVFVSGIQRTDPVLQVTKPAQLRVGNRRYWITPAYVKETYDTDKHEPIGKSDRNA